jgi:hypothetical protein
VLGRAGSKSKPIASGLTGVLWSRLLLKRLKLGVILDTRLGDLPWLCSQQREVVKISTTIVILQSNLGKGDK